MTVGADVELVIDGTASSRIGLHKPWYDGGVGPR